MSTKIIAHLANAYKNIEADRDREINEEYAKAQSTILAEKIAVFNQQKDESIKMAEVNYQNSINATNTQKVNAIETASQVFLAQKAEIESTILEGIKTKKGAIYAETLSTIGSQLEKLQQQEAEKA